MPGLRWLPRSLYGRNLLLIVGLIALSQLSTALLFRELIQKPRVHLTAESVARNLLALHHGLAGLPPDERAAFVEQFNESAGMVARRAEPASGPQGGDHLRPLERTFVQDVSRLLAEQGDAVIWRRDAGGMLAVRLRLEGEDFWLSLPSLIPAHEFTGAWLVSSAAAGVLAVGGAWLIQRRINRPLRAVVRAAHQLGQGGVPEPLPEDGPSEIATVSHGFNQMVQDLGRAERERAVMLAGLSHDLRTPLTKLRLSAEILGGQGDALTAGMVRHIETIDGLLEQFLEFSRLGATDPGQSEPAIETDLNALVRDAAVSATESAVEAAAELAAEPAPDAVTFDLQASGTAPLRVQALRRLVVNLVVNAQRHGRPPIEVVTGGAGAAWWIEVRDRGPGLAPAEAERLKQPFQRGDASRSLPGSGLGLAIVERIARLHGATFELLPREGGGLRARVACAAGQAPG
jgi:two-component system osmolarity sensor histidine kinase EnvZ